MRVVFGSPGRLIKSAALFLAAATLFLATESFAHAANPNGNPHAFRVVDRRGRLVGYSLTDHLVARQINGVWVTFYAHPASGIFDSRAIYLYYLTSDCSGTPYVTHYSNFSEGTRVGSTMYYPTDAQEFTPRSLRVAFGSGEEGACSLAPNVSGAFGVATTIDIDSFGLEPPFKAVD